jgi:transposase
MILREGLPLTVSLQVSRRIKRMRRAACRLSTKIEYHRIDAAGRSNTPQREVALRSLIDEPLGQLDLSLYYAQIASVQGRAGREHTDPQLLIGLWLYAYSRGISSGREIARRCEYEPAFQWLCGLGLVSHRTLSGFRSGYKAALDDLFVQVLGMLSAEGLITMERVTLDGTKIKANASGNTFRRKEKIEAHLELAREQVRLMDEQAADEEKTAKRRAAGRRRGARQRTSRLEAALREVERMQRDKKYDRDGYVARASSTDPEAHVMRNGEGGTAPSYNVQLVTDTGHGLIVNVEATTDAIDYRQLEPALDRCQETLGCKPKQIVADGDYTNHASVKAAATGGVDFYGSWQDSWKPAERDAQGRRAAFLSSAFPYNAELDCFTCPAGQTMKHVTIQNRGHGVRTHLYRAPKGVCRNCTHRNECAPQKARDQWVRSITRIEESAETAKFKAKMETEQARLIYSQRSQIAEFPHAWIKERCGLRQFRCRGRLKVGMEATWACLSYNITRWFRIRRDRITLEACAVLA